MVIIVNGKEERYAESLSISDLLKLKDVNPDDVVVELNMDIVSKIGYSGIFLQDRDIVEILRFVGGG